MLRTMYVTMALLAVVSLLVPSTNAQIAPFAPTQPQLQTQPQAQSPIPTPAASIPTVSGTNIDGEQHIIPLKSTYDTATQIITNMPGFTITEQDVIALEENGVFVVIPQQGQVTLVTITTTDGLESVDLQKGSEADSWSLRNLPEGEEFIATIKTDLGTGTELINETIIVLGGAPEDKEGYYTIINKYITNTQVVNKVTVNVTKKPQPGGPGPGGPQPGGPGPGGPQPGGPGPGGPQPGGPGDPRGTPIKIFLPGRDGKCPAPSTLQGANCILPDGWTVFSPAAVNNLDIAPNGDIINRVPGKTPVVVCPSLKIPKPRIPGDPPDPNPQLTLSCSTMVLPDGRLAVGVDPTMFPIPQSASNVGASIPDELSQKRSKAIQDKIDKTPPAQLPPPTQPTPSPQPQPQPQQPPDVIIVPGDKGSGSSRGGGGGKDGGTIEIPGGITEPGEPGEPGGSSSSGSSGSSGGSTPDPGEAPAIGQ
jgi:hypothetical protein